MAVRTRAREESSPAIPRVAEDSGNGKKDKRRDATGSRDGSELPQPLAGDGSAAGGKVARLERVMELTGLGRSSIYNRTNPQTRQYDPSFPRSFSLGADGGAVGWDEEEVKAWVVAQAAGRRKRDM